VREVDILGWLNECRNAGLVRVYQVLGKAYLMVLDFRQQVRAATSRYPEPPPFEPLPSTCVADAQQPIADAHLDGDVVVVGDEGVVEDERARKAATVAPTDTPQGVTAETWEAWRRHRGKKLTPDALRLQRKRLAEWAADGHDPNAIVERAVMNGWQGLHPPDKPRKTVGGRPQSLAERRTSTLDNIINGTPQGHERTIEGTAERVGSEAAETLPVDLREQGRNRLRHG
jgi:hypothetical protein